VSLSKWLVFLIAVRPMINQFRGDTSLLKLGDYNVSVLSLWSITYLLVSTARLQHGPPAPQGIRRAILAFLGIVLVFGVPRMFLREALITDVLAYFQFFLAALTARGVIDDLGIDFVIRRMALGAIALLAMHLTAPVWMPDRSDILQDIEGTYLGGFEDKHIAARTFFALVPYLACGALRDRKGLSTLLLIPVTLFMVLALQRVSMLSSAIFALALLVMARRIRVMVPMLVVAVSIIAFVPSERFESFVESKVQQEIDAYKSGDLESSGAGRMAIVFLAQDWYLNQSTVEEQLIGRGTAQAYQLHYLAVGHMAYAHIEVVELLIDYGLIGTVLAFVILIRIGREKLAALRRHRAPEELVGMAMTVVIIAEMFYAMPLQDGGTITLFAFWLFAPLSTDIREPVR
jgi:hypothetical protein